MAKQAIKLSPQEVEKLKAGKAAQVSSNETVKK
jgi:hypothetical protein